LLMVRELAQLTAQCVAMTTRNGSTRCLLARRPHRD